MAFSNIAAIINDYAVTEAKRSGAEQIGAVHLLLAVSRFRQERFDAEFPGLADSLRMKVKSTKGSAPKPTGYSSDLESQLESVKSEGDLWAMVAQLSAQVGSDLSPPATPPDASLAHTGSGSEISAPDPGGSVETADRSTGNGGEARSEFPLTSELAARVASTLRGAIDRVAELLAQDALWISTHVSSTPVDGVHDAIASGLQVKAIPSAPNNDLSDVVRQLVALRTADSSALARQLALMYVAVATWAAAADAEVTEEEVSRIDSLRLRLRDDLAGAVHDESAPLDAFDRVFADLVGMDPVKAELRRRIDHYVVAQRRRARGLSSSMQTMHMGFLGNPGTGKTEVARRFAAVLHEMGLLRRGHLVEVDRSGLVAEYVGQTEKRTTDVINRALGGVLFIDEAYSVGADAGEARGYGQQIIDVLVKALEDHREDLVVIFAGYEQPMMNFFGTNEGLRSRVPTFVIFEDYSSEELVKIALRMAQSDGYSLSDGALERLRDGVETLRSEDGFGNARSMRNLYEASIRNQSTRVSELGDLATSTELQEVLEVDVPLVEVPEDQSDQAFGFARRGVSD